MQRRILLPLARISVFDSIDQSHSGKMVRDRKGAVDSRMGQHHRAAAFPRGLSRLIDVGIFHLTQACSIRLAEKLFIERTVDGVGIASSISARRICTR